jgi:protein tyrosine phosphatase
MLEWVIERQLVRGPRPGYLGERGRQVPKVDVDAWIEESKRSFGIRSIICLLHEEHLKLYESLPADLLSYYRASGFEVKHIPVRDHQSPPLCEDDLKKVWDAYTLLAKPVLVHCSAGCDRTGKAVHHIKRQLRKSARTFC